METETENQKWISKEVRLFIYLLFFEGIGRIGDSAKHSSKVIWEEFQITNLYSELENCPKLRAQPVFICFVLAHTCER